MTAINDSRMREERMEMLNSDHVDKLCRLAVKDAVDWAAFDTVLDAIEDINAIDEEEEETYLTSCIQNAGYGGYGAILPEMIRHFLGKGYDVKANDGRNGGLCLSALCWSTYDQYIIDAAKVLLLAGAPLEYPSIDSEPGCLSRILDDISDKVSGAWVVDKDYSWANIIETYYQIVRAAEAGKPFDWITTYHDCIGKRLDRVEFIGDGRLQTAGNAVAGFDGSLVFWFDGMPLVISNNVEFIVNPNTVKDNPNSSTNVDDVFPSLIGSALLDLTYIDQITCFLDFDNGKRLFITSIDDGAEERKGLFEIRQSYPVRLSETEVERVCIRCGRTYAENQNEYEEEAAALIQGNAATLLFSADRRKGRRAIRAVSCSLDLAREFNRALPLEKPDAVKLFRKHGMLTKIRIRCGEASLVVQADDDEGLKLTVRSSEE